MVNYPQALMDEALRLCRLGRKAMSNVRIDYAQWSDEARSSPIAFLDEFYSDTSYKCYSCGTDCTFSPADKKHVYETLKKRLEWHPTLCGKCYGIRAGLEREQRNFVEEWQSSRSALRGNIKDLNRWLTVLEELPKFSVKRDSAKISQLRKLVMRKPHC